MLKWVDGLIPWEDQAERQRLLAAAGAFGCVAAASLLARIAGDTLLLSTYGREVLASLYLGTAGIVGVSSLVFGMLAGRFATRRLVAGSAVILIFLLLGVWGVLQTGVAPVRIAAYLMADFTVSGSMLLFWIFFGEVFDARKARRFLGFTGAAGTITCMIAASLVGRFNAVFGVPQLLLVVAVLLACFGILVWRQLGCEASPAAVPATGRAGGSTGWTSGFGAVSQPNVRALAVLVAAATAGITLVDYQFKTAAQAAYPPAELAGFFGGFFATANVAVLLVQLFAVSYLLRRAGLLQSISLLPAILLALAAWGVYSWNFELAVASRFAVQVLAFTLDSAALHVLYLGVRKQSYRQARAFVDGLCKPAAMGMTGFLLFAGSGWLGPREVSAAVAITAAAWVLLARVNYRVYLAALVESLRAKLLYPDERPEGEGERSVEQFARERLLEAPPEDLPYLLALLDNFPKLDLTREMRELLRREDTEARVAALERIRLRGTPEDLAEVVPYHRDPAPRVRRAAILAVSALGAESAADALLAGVQDPDPHVRAESAAALLRTNDLNGLMIGSQAFKDMMDSPDDQARCAVAQTLARVELTGREGILSGLLEDPEPDVVRAALEACAERPIAALVPALFNCLNRLELASATVEAVVAAGEASVRYLQSRDDAELEEMFTSHPVLFPSLARIGHAAFPLVRRLLHSMRLTPGLADCYRRMYLKSPRSGELVRELEHLVLAELELLAVRRRQLRAVEIEPDAEFLRLSLAAAIDRHLDNVFILLEGVVNGVDMLVLRRRYGSARPEERTRTIEILQNLLPMGLRSTLPSLLEGRTVGGLEKSVLARTLLKEIAEPALATGAAWWAGRSGRADLLEWVLPLVHHPSPWCRETALRVSALLGADLLPDRSDDPDPAVRRLSLVLNGAAGGRVPMINIEKALFLRKIPLFSSMKPVELAVLAQISQEVVFGAGTPIIKEGELGETMYLVVDGHVKVHRKEVELGRLGPGEYFGEMSILDGEPRSASVTAQTDCLLLSVHRRDFSDLLTQHIDMARAVIDILNQRLRTTLSLLDGRSSTNLDASTR